MKAINYTIVSFVLLVTIGLALLYQLTPIFNLSKYEKKECLIDIKKFSVLGNQLNINLDYNKYCYRFDIAIKNNKKTLCTFTEVPKNVITLTLNNCNLTHGKQYILSINGKDLTTFYYP